MILQSYFKLSEHGTNVRTEVLAGLTTFLTMVYIIFVNAEILSNAGMDRGAVFVATCLAAAVGTLIIGVYAKYPIALAPGMGLNAFFTYTIVLNMGVAWQTALGMVFLSGILFLILSVLPVRAWIIDNIPMSLKMATCAGIGLFLGFIGLENAGVVVDHPATLVTVGELTSWPVLLTALGFITIIALDQRKVPGAIIIGILLVTAIAVALGLAEAKGIVSTPPSLAPTFFQLDLVGALQLALIPTIFAMLFVDLFDTAGTLVGLAYRAKMLDDQGRLPRLRQALVADSSATVAGALFGTSTTTSYIESAAGINAGGRTGLTAVVTAVLFLFALFLSPLAATIPPFATAPALLFVACLMARGLAGIDWDDVTEAAPAVVTAISIPFTFSSPTESASDSSPMPQSRPSADGTPRRDRRCS